MGRIPEVVQGSVRVLEPMEGQAAAGQSMVSAAMSADGRAVVTFGPRCSEPWSRSALLSWLRSGSAAGSARSEDTAAAGQERSEGTAAAMPDGKPSGTVTDGAKVAYIVLHCSDTWPSARFGIEKLKASHRKAGYGEWPGYHFYVTRDGTLYYCRPLSVRGCHARGFNTGSIAVCYEGGRREECRQWHQKECEHCGKRGCTCPKGLHVMSPWEDNRTAEQVVTLHELLSTLVEMCPKAQLLGHRDLPGVKKACPCLDTRREYAYLTTARGADG